MGIIKRIHTIVNGNLNDLIDKMEDPEKAVKQMVRDMEQAYSEMKHQAALAIATVKITEKKIETALSDQKLWQENAEDALRSGNEDMAKKALMKRKGVDNTLAMLNIRLNESREFAEKLKDELKYLEAKLREAAAKRDSLINRKRAVDAKKKLYDASESVSRKLDGFAAAENALDGYRGFELFEEKIEKQIAEIEAREELSGNNLEREFENMKMERELTAELEALKSAISRQA